VKDANELQNAEHMTIRPKPTVHPARNWESQRGAATLAHLAQAEALAEHDAGQLADDVETPEGGDR